MWNRQFSNRVAQDGTYRTGSPNYFDVSSGSALPGYLTVDAQASADSWIDGCLVGVWAKVDNSNYIVALCTWDATNSHLLIDTVEESVGSIADSTAVQVFCGMTKALLEGILYTPEGGNFESVTASRDVTGADAGKIFIVDSSSIVTLTLKSTVPVGAHIGVYRAGTGSVVLATEGTDTINGSTSASLAAQYGSAYVMQPLVDGTWYMSA